MRYSYPVVIVARRQAIEFDSEDGELAPNMTSEAPKVSFDDNEGANKPVCLAGQQRQAAVRVDFAAKESIIKEMEEDPNGDRKEIKMLRERLKGEGYWIAAIYDQERLLDGSIEGFAAQQSLADNRIPKQWKGTPREVWEMVMAWKDQGDDEEVRAMADWTASKDDAVKKLLQEPRMEKNINEFLQFTNIADGFSFEAASNWIDLPHAEMLVHRFQKTIEQMVGLCTFNKTTNYDWWTSELVQELNLLHDQCFAEGERYHCTSGWDEKMAGYCEGLRSLVKLRFFPHIATEEHHAFTKELDGCMSIHFHGDGFPFMNLDCIEWDNKAWVNSAEALNEIARWVDPAWSAFGPHGGHKVLPSALSFVGRRFESWRKSSEDDMNTFLMEIYRMRENLLPAMALAVKKSRAVLPASKDETERYKHISQALMNKVPRKQKGRKGPESNVSNNDIVDEGKLRCKTLLNRTSVSTDDFEKGKYSRLHQELVKAVMTEDRAQGRYLPKLLKDSKVKEVRNRIRSSFASPGNPSPYWNSHGEDPPSVTTQEDIAKLKKHKLRHEALMGVTRALMDLEKKGLIAQKFRRDDVKDFVKSLQEETLRCVELKEAPDSDNEFMKLLKNDDADSDDPIPGTSTTISRPSAENAQGSSIRQAGSSIQLTLPQLEPAVRTQSRDNDVRSSRQEQNEHTAKSAGTKASKEKSKAAAKPAKLNGGSNKPPIAGESNADAEDPPLNLDHHHYDDDLDAEGSLDNDDIGLPPPATAILKKKDHHPPETSGRKTGQKVANLPIPSASQPKVPTGSKPGKQRAADNRTAQKRSATITPGDSGPSSKRSRVRDEESSDENESDDVQQVQGAEKKRVPESSTGIKFTNRRL
ncbi:hypothetical protein FRC03_008695 [Tulasnella sp. 419]|nr:hypothetical protein FRC03_008695 [Tulasnella sp. 419]